MKKLVKTYQFFVIRHSGNKISQLVVVDSIWSEQLFGKFVGPPRHEQISEICLIYV